MDFTSSLFQEETFETVLQRVLLHRELTFELLGHSEFRVRGYLICCRHLQGTKDDPLELFQTGCLKVLLSKDKLRAESTPNKEAFFGWFRQLTLNILKDQWRKSNRDRDRLIPLTYSNEESANDEDREITDLKVDLEKEFLRKEFKEFTKTLPVKYRYATVQRLKNYPDRGCPYEKIAEELRRMGFECTAPTVRSWVLASLNAFLNGGRIAHDGDQVARKKKAVNT